MARTMFAQVDDSGTAMSETAICGECATGTHLPDSLLDCSRNDALSCEVCGVTTTRLPQLTSHIQAGDDFDPCAQNVLLDAIRTRDGGAPSATRLSIWRAALLYGLDPVKHEAEAQWSHVPEGLWDDRWISGRTTEADTVEAALDAIAHTDFDSEWCPSCQVMVDQLLHAIRVVDRLLVRADAAVAAAA